MWLLHLISIGISSVRLGLLCRDGGAVIMEQVSGLWSSVPKNRDVANLCLRDSRYTSQASVWDYPSRSSPSDGKGGGWGEAACDRRIISASFPPLRPHAVWANPPSFLSLRLLRWSPNCLPMPDVSSSPPQWGGNRGVCMCVRWGGGCYRRQRK